ncbi:MAG: hypothetical protein QXP66_00935 [Candidatus Aenigmatarchaeota archaeon]
MKLRFNGKIAFVTPIGVINPGAILNIETSHPKFSFFEDCLKKGMFELVEDPPKIEAAVSEVEVTKIEKTIESTQPVETENIEIKSPKKRKK